jgi:chromate transport protein ChrA
MKDVLHGITPAAVAMTFAMAFKTGQKCLRDPVAISLSIAIFLLSAVLRLPLIEAMAICGPAALWWGWPSKPKVAG